MTIIDDVKDRLDIVEVLSGYLKLTKAGANYRALCPFHKEKTPSFMISPERQIWHCFGCGEGGDIFKFVMKYENVEFPEALRLLAKRAGVELKKEDPRIQNEMLKLYGICEKAMEYFENNLKAKADVLDYLKKRGLKDETINYWHLGFAPESSGGLLQYLAKHNFKSDDIAKTGLIIKSQKRLNSYFDRFRSRVIFPICDNQDRVVGFTGRIFNDKDHPNEPKYLNSPESPIFSKGRLLYGFSQNKKAIREKEQAILVEGQMDFLMAWQDGIKNVVATSGTALTEEQIKTLKRTTKALLIGYDMDEAGRLATERAIDLAKNSDFRVQILTLSEGVKDVADFVLAQPGELNNLLAKSEDSGDYYYRIALNNLDKNDLEAKKKSVNFLLSKIKWLSSAVERSHWIGKIAEDLQIKEPYLEEELLKMKSEPRRVLAESAAETEPLKEVKTRKNLLNERILALAIKDESLRLRLIEVKQYILPDYLDVAEVLINNQFNDITDNVLAEKIGYFKLLADYELAEEEALAEDFEMAVRELRKEILRDKILQKTFLIKESEKINDLEELNKNLSEFGELLKEFAQF
ncbi:MAG: DNA primase [bacterium]|nr:DNA primase [bacterium]